MSCSPADSGALLGELAATYGQALAALGAGDLRRAAASVEDAAGLLAVLTASGAVMPDAAALARARAQHTRLLAMVTSEHVRCGVELTRLRAGRRTLRSYGARRAQSRGAYSA
jgi:hypothetical protein